MDQSTLEEKLVLLELKRKIQLDDRKQERESFARSSGFEPVVKRLTANNLGGARGYFASNSKAGYKLLQ